ncbi:MAG: helix-turn-helix transcriptional regulator [Ruminococcus sp.]|nr:helix-turn-helix transcriptional regulator [Ruminococcus sp.]
MTTAELLISLRRQNNYSMQQVADKIGMSLSGYRKYEYGQREVSSQILVELADLYGVSTDYLLGRGSEEETNDTEKDTIEQLVDELDMSSLEESILRNYSRLPNKIRKEFRKFLDNVISDNPKTESVTQSATQLLKVALFDNEDVPDEKLEEVISYASYVKNKSDDNQDG